jgi:hypothetical protein
MSRQAVSILDLTVRASGAVSIHRGVGYDGAQATVQGQKVIGVSRYAAADGTDFAVTTHGTAIVETGAEVAVGDSLICDDQGRAIPATGPLGVAAGATPVTSTAADGAILEGADLPEFVFADALQAAGGAGKFIEVKLRG